MGELSTEVKAKETHENASFYYNRADYNIYKFLLEVKKIRDDRYYKELGYSNFEEYCQNAWGFSRQWINAKIQSASNLNESDFDNFSFQFGSKKTFLLATMGDEQREQAINEGIPTEQGEKSIDEATQKEISEYKKRAKQAEHQAEMEQKERERLENENEELANQEPDTVYPDDYDYYKGNYESAVALRDRYKEQLEEMREELNNKEPEIKEVVPEDIQNTLSDAKKRLDQVTKENDELKKENDSFKNGDTSKFDEEKEEREKRMLELDAEKNVLRFKIKVDEFLQDVSVNAFMEGAIASSGKSTKEKLENSVDQLKSFTNKMETAIKGRVEI